jgi:tetratricopeptide (TPR) repeat protein
VDTALGRAETRKERGNVSFKEGDYPQAAAHYTSALALNPSHHVALANRSACFLKMGEHDKALADAETCVASAPEFVKGHFRRGLSLHALSRFGEAAAALEVAERLDPKNAQIKEALRMASFKARQRPRDD